METSQIIQNQEVKAVNYFYGLNSSSEKCHNVLQFARNYLMRTTTIPALSTMVYKWTLDSSLQECKCPIAKGSFFSQLILVFHVKNSRCNSTSTKHSIKEIGKVIIVPPLIQMKTIALHSGVKSRNLLIEVSPLFLIKGTHFSQIKIFELSAAKYSHTEL